MLKLTLPPGKTFTTEQLMAQRSPGPNDYIPSGIYHDQHGNYVIRPSFRPVDLNGGPVPLLELELYDADSSDIRIVPTPTTKYHCVGELDSVWTRCPAGTSITYTQENP